jgi:NitT/TauT family transport system permease protein
MLHKRLGQFLLVYGSGFLFLYGLKQIFGLSDYVIPSFRELGHTTKSMFILYVRDVTNTLLVAIVGHMLSIFLATCVGIIGRLSNWTGTLIRTAAFNIQAYPIVALAPIIFILLGDGLSSRLLIASMICYFPLLLSILGILSTPVKDVEHFYIATGKLGWRMEVGIRVFESLSKVTTVVVGSATLAVVGTIVAEFIAADAGIGHSIRIALYQSDMGKILVALFLIGIYTSLYLTLLEWIGFSIQKRWHKNETF